MAAKACSALPAQLGRQPGVLQGGARAAGVRLAIQRRAVRVRGQGTQWWRWAGGLSGLWGVAAPGMTAQGRPCPGACLVCTHTVVCVCVCFFLCMLVVHELQCVCVCVCVNGQ